MNNKPTIVFDLDGTLVDSIPDIIAALNRTLGGYRLPPFARSEVAHLTAHGGIRAMISHGFALSDRTFEPKDLEEAFAVTVADYDRNIAVDTVLYPGVRSSLETFRSEGWLLAICTNKPIAQTDKLLRILQLEAVFHAVSGVDSFDFKKPDPRHLTCTIEKAGGVKGRAVMVGDTYTDIHTAQNASVPVIAVDFGYSDVNVREFMPDRVISSFDVLYDVASELID